jgi:hypothetical protein
MRRFSRRASNTVGVNRSASNVAESATPLDQAIREKLIAVVVDANAYGEAGPDVARLSRLAADLARSTFRRGFRSRWRGSGPSTWLQSG